MLGEKGKKVGETSWVGRNQLEIAAGGKEGLRNANKTAELKNRAWEERGVDI